MNKKKNRNTLKILMHTQFALPSELKSSSNLHLNRLKGGK